MPGQHFTNGRNGTIPDPRRDFGGGGGGGVGRIAVRAREPDDGRDQRQLDVGHARRADVNAIGSHPTIYGDAKFQ